MLPTRLSIGLPLLLLACGGSSAGEIGDPSDPAPSGAATGSATDPSTPAAPADPGGPRVHIKAKGSLSPFAHKDGLSGQTAKVQIAAIKSLYLLRSASDPSPVKVYDLGDKSVLVDYVTGAPVELASVPIRSLPSGVYRLAKVGVSYVRYSVPARMHVGGYPVDGQYDNVQALSDGAMIEGAPRQKGWYRYAFSANGTTYGSQEGAGAPTPASPTSGGVTLDTSASQSFYVFAVDVALDNSVTQDHDVLFDTNVKDAFRWQDQALVGFTAGVFDTTPTSFEPVMAFGANAFSVAFSRSP